MKHRSQRGEWRAAAILALFLAVLLLAGCGPQTPQPTATLSPASPPAATPAPEPTSEPRFHMILKSYSAGGCPEHRTSGAALPG